MYEKMSEAMPSESGKSAAPMAAARKMDDESMIMAEESDSGNLAVPDADVRKPEERKRIYNGSAGLVVENPQEIRESLEKMTEMSGGYVEQSYENSLILRVPAGLFDSIFKQILTMGSIRYQQVETWDVTDAYSDTAARLATAETTRNRLYDLLEKSTKPEERARILKDIGRLTEEIESIKQQLQIMDSRIAFTRITVELIPRLADEGERQNIPFPWIARLSPLHSVSDILKARVKLDPGEGFALFDKEKIFAAEDASGTSIHISSIKNQPRGDALFWQKALRFHLKEYYAQEEEKNLNFGNKPLAGIEFLSKDNKPFRYFAGVVEDAKYLHVIEIFSPDGNRNFMDIYVVLEKGEIQ